MGYVLNTNDKFPYGVGLFRCQKVDNRPLNSREIEAAVMVGCLMALLPAGREWLEHRAIGTDM